MAANPNLFIETFESIEGGDTLLLMGGIFPRQNETSDVKVGLKIIIPILHIVTGRDQYSPRENPLFGPEDEDPSTLTLERTGVRFGHDYGEGPEITFGKKAGMILGRAVDIVILNPMSQNTFYFIGKPSVE